MHFAFVLQSADTGLGRVDHESFSDQTLMELLLESFPDSAKEQYLDDGGMYLDVCSWPNVKCDANARVTEVSSLPPRNGSVELSYIPRKVKTFVMHHGRNLGTLDTSALPGCLESLYVNGNALRGTVDFTALPGRLVKMSICNNAFTGSAVLNKLPQTLRFLWMQKNKFGGTVCLNHLPPSLETLHMSDNAFCGDFRLENTTETLSYVVASYNSFNAIAVVPKANSVRFQKCGVESVLDEEGETHEREKEMLK